MSRIGKEPIAVPDGVAVTLQDENIHIKGKLGELSRDIPQGISVDYSDGFIRITRVSDEPRQRALHGLSRALIANMVDGVTKGFFKDLEIVGVGYRCELRGKALQLLIGFSHRVVFLPPDGIEFKVASPNNFSVHGIDKQLVGEVAAKVRALRPPEPYKGKGIKYAGEYVRRKAGKTAGK